jgi:hypothetical protein
LVTPVQVTVVLLTGAAGVHPWALAYPVKAALVTGKATVASIQANLLGLERFIASATHLVSPATSRPPTSIRVRRS